jgi:DNA-binding beta-propeller fold protein YncE
MWICMKIAAGMVGCVALVTNMSGQTYKVLSEYKVSGTHANGIALDSAARRVLVATDEGLVELNADTGEAVGSLPTVKGAMDVLLIPGKEGQETGAASKGFVSGSAGEVVAFSLPDLKPLANLRVGAPGPSALCYDGEANMVVAVTASGTLTTIDAAADKVLKTAKLPTGAGQIVCGNMNQVYVADPASNVVHVLNHETMKSEGDLPMMTGRKPTGLTLDTKGRRLFVTCEDGTIEIIDTDSGFTFIELKGGTGIAHETFAWLPQGKGQWKAAAFVAQQDGTLSGIRMNAYINYSMGGQYKLGPGLGAIAYDEKTHRLYMTATRSGSPALVVAGF